jgi:two-component system NtrC family sensor kinase
MLRNEIAIGTIGITRRESGSFDDKTVDLLKTFADQAVIAIENARLFNETKEALARQTATSDVLKVIASSPSNLQPVFDAIAERSNELMSGHATTVFRFVGETAELAAFTSVSTEADAVLRAAFPRPISTLRNFEQVSRGQIAETIDAAANTEPETSRNIARARGFRSRLVVPLKSDSSIIGAISITRRQPGAFAPQDVELLRTFADQAVIAIENVRLFDEVQARTADLSESLQQQTATAEVLRVIASSPTDVKPVLNAIVESACKLCEASDAYVALKDDDYLVFQTQHGSIPVAWKRRPINRQWPAGRAVVDGQSVHLRDVLALEGDEFPDGREIAHHDGARTVLTVPLMREGESIGVIILRRTEVLPFSDKQIALLQTFADQAVIAIENVRLFDEVQAKTADLTESLEQQTATSEVLQVIGSTPGDLEPVFKSMLENATRVCGANFGQMNLYADGRFRPVALYNMPPAYAASLAHGPPFQPHSQSGLGTVARTHQVVHIEDSRKLPPYLEGDPSVVAISDLAGARSYFVVPMLKENELIGAITIYRQEVKPFTVKQTELVANFANQAVIAIDNTRLLNELRERTTELSQSLDELRTAQDRLVQTEKLASLGQLTAGIAHEIKNPLNFVNNFSALSTELIEEMKDMLSDVSLDKNKRNDLDEITQMLKSNLDKVVQHGKRADSIVKNMLLHSRQGSGEHRPVDINAIVDESLNLAYHGARAENTGFNITTHRSFDPAVGMADGYPQEITRALLNLISNGFYAATRRKADAGDGFEPTLTATTKNLGDKVEIRIRDNGTGIPTEVKEKIFNPFFTTKPAGEGTGLGLSMSHDIIVKQHGGTIDVDTALGVFTEFKIVLPRAGASLIKPGEHP